mmetsp:Transcript_7409/g.16292  ORF Transcript_7409/g.16292 Transcript_7409/m.16292 type:complete len:277 (-) Transcript_7409:40-870(-)
MGGEGLRHVVHRRVHKERPQPEARKRLGYLEKKKDYVKRAKDYHEKQDKLKELHKKAFFKNQEEFAFAMVRTKQAKDGTVEKKGAKLSHEELMLLNTQDHRYINHRTQIDKKAIEKQSRGLHFLNTDAGGKHTIFVDDEDLVRQTPATSSTSTAAVPAAATAASGSGGRVARKKLKDFDVASYFDTHPELLKNKSNRLRSKQLKSKKVIDTTDVAADMKEAYYQLVARQERAKKLTNIGHHLDHRTNMRKKGRRIKVADAVDGRPPVFRWDPQRKK